jgi:signal peptidase II
VVGIGCHAMTPHLRRGIIAAIVVLALDQASKLWLLFVFDIGHRGAVRLTPFFDLVLAWNVGISFGWFQNDGDFALFHLQIGGNTFNWYVFNLADVAIVAGVAALLYDSFLGVPAAKAP